MTVDRTADRPADIPPSAPAVDALRLQVAAVLGEDPSAIADTDDLLDLGLDSIRLMLLVERWRAQGRTVDPADLAEQPTLAGWADLLTPGAGSTA